MLKKKKAKKMLNTEFFKPVNFLTLSVIVLIWITIHEKFIKSHIVKDGAK